MNFVELLTAREVADLLKVSVRRVHALVREGRLACVQISPRDRRFLPEHVESFVKNGTITPPPKAIDTDRPKGLPSPAQVQLKSAGGQSVRALLREEMRRW